MVMRNWIIALLLMVAVASFGFGFGAFGPVGIPGGQVRQRVPEAVAGGPTWPLTNSIATWLPENNRVNSNDYVNGIYPDVSGHSVTGSSASATRPAVEDDGTDVRLHFDNVNDRIDWHVLGTDITNMTVGAISAWFRLDADNGAQEVIWAASRNADASRTEVFLDADMRTSNNRLDVLLQLNGSVRYQCYPTSGKLVAGTWYHVVVEHNATTVLIWTNGVSAALTFATSADKTPWLQDCFGHSTPSDSLTIGDILINGGGAADMDGMISSCIIYTNTVLGTNSLTIFNSQKSNYGY